MQLEAEIRTDPRVRADRFVERWNKLSGQADRAYVTGDFAARKSVQNEMVGMAKSLERDPQLESLLAARKAELGKDGRGKDRFTSRDMIGTQAPG